MVFRSNDADRDIPLASAADFTDPRQPQETDSRGDEFITFYQRPAGTSALLSGGGAQVLVAQGVMCDFPHGRRLGSAESVVGQHNNGLCK